MLKEYLQKLRERKEENNKKFNDAYSDRKIERTILEREKSPEQRELEGYKKDEYERNVKKELTAYRKKWQKDVWGKGGLSKNYYGETKNVFKNKPIFKAKCNLIQ